MASVIVVGLGMIHGLDLRCLKYLAVYRKVGLKKEVVDTTGAGNLRHGRGSGEGGEGGGLHRLESNGEGRRIVEVKE